jgi:hypothetical protein
MRLFTDCLATEALCQRAALRVERRTDRAICHAPQMLVKMKSNEQCERKYHSAGHGRFWESCYCSRTPVTAITGTISRLRETLLVTLHTSQISSFGRSRRKVVLERGSQNSLRQFTGISNSLKLPTSGHGYCEPVRFLHHAMNPRKIQLFRGFLSVSNTGPSQTLY